MPFFRKKKSSLEEEAPGELGRIRDELNAPVEGRHVRRLPNPEDVPEDELGEPIRRELPPDLESLIGPPEHEKPKDEQKRGHAENDRLELILSKLDTIDSRLKFIEEKLKRF